jgi:hypothetical protein
VTGDLSQGRRRWDRAAQTGYFITASGIQKTLIGASVARKAAYIATKVNIDDDTCCKIEPLGVPHSASRTH